MRERLRALADSLESPRRRPVVVSGLVVGLILATTAAFAVAQRLKLERSPVTAPQIPRVIGPLCECERARRTLSVRLRERAVVTASIVDGNGNPVRVLADREARTRGPVTYVWDGRDDDGEVVRDGRYRLRLRLEDQHRTITVPTRIRIDSRPPRVRLLEVAPTTFSPDGDGRSDQVRFRYESSEPGYARVEIDGEPAIRGLSYPAGPGRLRWRGRIGGEPAEPGTYAARIVVVDAAGNRSRRTRRTPLALRYVELRAVPVRVERGRALRFSLEADARRVPVLIEAASGRGKVVLRGTFRPGQIRLPLDVAPGRYTLRATVGPQTARASFRVVRR